MRRATFAHQINGRSHLEPHCRGWVSMDEGTIFLSANVYLPQINRSQLTSYHRMLNRYRLAIASCLRVRRRTAE